MKSRQRIIKILNELEKALPNAKPFVAFADKVNNKWNIAEHYQSFKNNGVTIKNIVVKNPYMYQKTICIINDLKEDEEYV